MIAVRNTIQKPEPRALVAPPVWEVFHRLIKKDKKPEIDPNIEKDPTRINRY